MSPHDKIDPDVLAAALKRCNGSWLQKALLGALLANIGALIYGVGTLMVNDRLLSNALADIKEMKITDNRLDKEVARSQATLEGHEVRIVSLENSKSRN